MEEFVKTILSNVPSTKHHFKRNEYLVSEGDKNQNIYAILNGAVRVFYLSENEEFTIRFGYEGSMISMLPTYFTGKGSLFYMQALRSTEVLVIEKCNLDEMIVSNPNFLQNYNELLQEILAQQMEREIDLLTTSPQERLFRVMQRSPKVFQEIPLKYLASYLRMTPETLSRIMKANS